MEHIELTDFRCYEHFEITFSRGINLLIGDNASGKTSLLMACKYILSTYFSGYSTANTHWETPKKEDFTIRQSDTFTEASKEMRIDFTLNAESYGIYERETERAIGMEIPQEIQSIVKTSIKNSRAQKTPLRSITAYGQYLQRNSNQTVPNGRSVTAVLPLPLFAYFSTEDVHQQRKESVNMSKFIVATPGRDLGYYECLNGGALLRYWVKRMLVLKEAQCGDTELNIVNRAIAEALGEEGCGVIRGLDIKVNARKVDALFTDGRSIEVASLSDGYHRVVNIVVGIAERCALLNGGYYGKEAAHETRGTVLIDEIDMHLHPSMQMAIMQGLQKAFPRLQFIATTHAPMVMTGIRSCPENSIFHLTYNGTSQRYEASPTNAYGMDASSILRLIFNIHHDRTPEIAQLIEETFDLIDSNRFTEARRKIAQLRKENELISEIVTAETMLNLNE